MWVDCWVMGDDYRLFSGLEEEEEGAMESGGKRTRGGATMDVTGLFPHIGPQNKHTSTHPSANCPFARSCTFV
jgi:hypothetical protein